MPSVLVKESAAASATGTNLMNGNVFYTSPRFRRVRRIGLVGSSNVGTGAVDLRYGATLVFNGLTPSTSGANVTPVEAKDMLPVASDYVCQPGEPINLVVTTASVTNPFVALLEIEEL